MTLTATRPSTTEKTEPEELDLLPQETTEDNDTPQGMQIFKRDGSREDVDINKIVYAIEYHASGLDGVDPLKIAQICFSGLYDGAATKDIDELAIRTAASKITEHPNYSKLAANMLAMFIRKELTTQDISSFTQSIEKGFELGLVSEETADFVRQNKHKPQLSVKGNRDKNFEYLGLRIVYDRYLLRHPQTRKVIESPQYFLMRVACGIAASAKEAGMLYDIYSSLRYLPSTPTLFNSGTPHSQMSSCYLIDSPLDDLEAIYDWYKRGAKLSKFAGGLGMSASRIRSDGSLIKGTNGLSNGVVPWLKTLDSSVAAVNQGGKRKGAACVYLETWHADIEDFLELKNNTGDHSRRTHNLNIANWIPDLFMRRVEQDEMWSLFDPKIMPSLCDLYGEEFEEAYIAAEQEGLYAKQVKAQDLYKRMLTTLGETGNGWMTFKDSANLKCNQTGEPGNVVHLSNLCTEILEVTDQDNVAVCNLGSLNLAMFVKDGEVDYKGISDTVRMVLPSLDRVIDRNFYPVDEAENSNRKWRPIGLGIMGLQDVFFKLDLPFDSTRAKEISTRIQEEIYLTALEASCDLARQHGPHETYPQTRASKGMLQPDLWEGGVDKISDPERWETIKANIAEHGLRNSLMIAIAPTATIASIAGCYECIEPQVSNLVKRKILSGEFVQINFYLIRKLLEAGLWDENMVNTLKLHDGSVQDIEGIPDEMKLLFRTAWELPMQAVIDMAADRGCFIDQSQSLNLFMPTPEIKKLSSMYMYAWQQGLKTTYYLRSRPATRINQTTTDTNSGTGLADEPKENTLSEAEAEALACSLENPESCEACT